MLFLFRVDIFTASWGPSDDGKTVEAPGKMAQRALEEGVQKVTKAQPTIFCYLNSYATFVPN